MRQKIKRPVVWKGKKERKKRDEKEKGVHVGQLQLARDGGGAVLQCSRNKQDHQAKHPFHAFALVVVTARAKHLSYPCGPTRRQSRRSREKSACGRTRSAGLYLIR